MSLRSPIGLVGVWFASLVTVVGYQQTGTSATAQNALQAVVRAAEAGNRDAQFALAVRFTNGDGVFQDDVQAATWFRASAERGLVEAQYWTGLAYAFGNGVQQDETTAYVWFRKAADNGHAKAQFMAGLAFMAGKSVERDVLRGLDRFRQGADQGYAPAQYAVALTFRPTAGVMDAGGAVQLMRNAAAQGYASARFALGRMLTAGSVNVLADPDKGPSRDDVEAYLWFDLCARHVETREERDISTWVHLGVTPGAADCAEARNELRNRMTAEQIGEGETRVLEWMTLADSSKR